MKKEIMAMISNQKNFPKHTLGYIINAIEANSVKGLYWDTCKRNELIEHFKGLLEDPSCLSRLTALVSFRKFREEFDKMEFRLVNKNGWEVMHGTYQECIVKKLKMGYFSENYKIDNITLD